MGSDLTEGRAADDDLAVTPGSPQRRALLVGLALVVAIAFAGMQLLPPAPAGRQANRASGSERDSTTAALSNPDEVRILAGEPASIDPAGHGDAGSAAVIAQLFETLTTFDPGLNLRPALAESWAVEADGRRVTFTLRDGLAFSDGSPLTAADVVASWRRLVDPIAPSPLATLLADVVGAQELIEGTTRDVGVLGVRAEGDRRVVVDLVRAASDFPAIVSAPPLAIVPADTVQVDLDPSSFVGSGAYVLDGASPDGLLLRGNEAYWAGPPPITTVRLLTDIGGASPVEAYEDGLVDVTAIADFDARWIAYDATLGPELRSSPALSVSYYGFDASEPPFDDVRVRRAFAIAVDWRRLAALDEPGQSTPATGIVPAGIPGRPEGEFLPAYDPDEARRLLAEAGFPGGAGLPTVTLMTAGGGYDDGVVADLERVLGIDVAFEYMDFDAYAVRLEEDPPDMWALTWVADYPSPNDFLGVLLRSGSTANYGRWRNADFDEVISRATSALSPDEADAGYREALELVRDEAPIVPVSYGVDWRLSRGNLLGATPNGMGILRVAGLVWAEGE